MCKRRWVRLCLLDELPDGAARGFDPFDEGRDALFIVRSGDTLNAFLNVCPHQGASLPWRKDAYLNADGSRIVCSAHGARFEISDGHCVLGAALGHSLTPVSLMLSADGAVAAKLLKDI